MDKSTENIVTVQRQAENVILKSMQEETFSPETECVEKKQKLKKVSVLSKLSPVLGTQGLLRVSGRLRWGDLTSEEKHPVILPGQHHVTTLIVEHLHKEIKHQGRHFTQGIVRARGYWIISGKRVINKVVYHCIKCRKLRGKLQIQKMADLPTK